MVRPAWSSAPAPVQAWAREVLGSAVVSAATQPTGWSPGWSPGAAARLTCANGRRAFGKAVGAAVNADTAALHRREARAAALLYEEVDGRAPASPWEATELDAALALLDRFARELTPCPAPLEQVGVTERFDGWARLAADGTALTPWESRHLHRLVALEDQWPQASAGSTLLHTDVRADSLLLRPNGCAVLVDWPGASVGAATSTSSSSRRPSCWTAAGPGRPPPAYYFQHRRRQPPPAGIRALRPFQAAQGEVVLDWLRRRTGWR